MSKVIEEGKLNVNRAYAQVDFLLDPAFFGIWSQRKVGFPIRGNSWIYAGGCLYQYDSDWIVPAVRTSIRLLGYWEGRCRSWTKGQDRNDQVQLELPFEGRTSDAGG